MNKKTIIVFAIIIVLIIAVAIYFMFGKIKPAENNAFDSVGMAQTVKTAAFERGNPFEVDINPLQVYKNPFAK